MSSITEQFSAVTKSQLEAQFQIFNSLAHTAVDSAEKLIALHINTTKASVEKSSAAAKKLLDIKDAKELFSASRETPTGIDSLLAYSRELFAIASGAQAELIKSTQGTTLPQLAAPWVAPVAEAAKTAAAPVAEVAKTAAAPVAAAVQAATPTETAAVLPAAEPAPARAAAPVAALNAEPAAAPAAAPTTAAVTEEPAPPATTIQAAVSAAVHSDAGPAVADTPAQLAPQPLAATVAPTAPEAIQPALKPAADTAPSAAVKPAFPAAKPIALAADTKTSKLKTIAPKAKSADAPAGKHKK